MAINFKVIMIKSKRYLHLEHFHYCRFLQTITDPWKIKFIWGGEISLFGGSINLIKENLQIPRKNIKLPWKTTPIGQAVGTLN